MDVNNFLKLAQVATQLNNGGFYKQSDLVLDSMIRIAAYWQGPLVELPLGERVVPFKGVIEKTYEEVDEERQKFPRYDEFNSYVVENGDWDSEEEDPFSMSLEVKLHPQESNPDAGIVFVFPDFASSTEQGSGWGKKMEEHDKNNASGERYKNLTPKFY
jgi:hypothetical protein